MKTRTMGIGLVLATTVLAACSTRIGDLTFVSTKNLGATYAPLQKRVRGEDCSYIILFIPVGSLNPNLEEATDRAVQQVARGDMLINASVYNDILHAFVFARNCVRVEGDVVSTTAGP